MFAIAPSDAVLTTQPILNVCQVPLQILALPTGCVGQAVSTLQHKLSGGEDVLKMFLAIHESVDAGSATPLRYVTFVRTYQNVYSRKKERIEDKQRHLQVI